MTEEMQSASTEKDIAEKQAPVYHRPDLKKVAGLLLIFVVLVVGGFALAQYVADNRPAGEKIVLTVDDLVISMNEEGPQTTTDTYKGQYVELTGTLAGLDSQGNYVRLTPLNDLDIKTKVCGRISEEQFAYVQTLNKGDTLTVTGTITNVGHILGIFLDVEDIQLCAAPGQMPAA
jgi:hypothetical protein